MIRALPALVLSALTALASLSFAGTARAEDLLVVALGGDATEAVRAPVLEAVAARFRADGFEVLGPAELVHRVPPSRLALASTEDAARLSASLGVPRVACVSVWATEAGVSELSLSLHALSGERSVRHTSATGTITAERDLATNVDAMVGEVLAGERAAAMLDPGAGTASATASETSRREPSAGEAAGSTRAEGSARTPPAQTGLVVEDEPGPERGGGGPEPLFGILGPGLLAAIGAAGIGLGVWASLDPTCDRWNADRSVCLRGEENNLGIGITLIITGVLSLSGAVIWWITDAQTPAVEPRIDVVLGPGSIGARGTF